MSTTPHVELCKTAAHLRECGECADEIGRILKEELKAVALPAPLPDGVDADGFELPVPMTSHADVPNAVDHPVADADKCGICITVKRQSGRRPLPPAAIISQLESL